MTIITQRNTTTSPIHELLGNRWSPRGFAADHVVGEEELRSLIEAARWAPSAFNKQPWGFIVGRRGTETFGKIFDSLAEFNQLWNRNVSALIVTLARTEIDGEPFATAHYDLGQAAAHLSFQAESLGLNVHQMTGFDADAIAERFPLPAGYQPYTVIAVGVHSTDESIPEKIRDRDSGPRERQGVDDILLGFE
ncbi:nitroreductase family protein [Gulosibacter sp. 10]|uniref:nitroreductase family protein n=1 Tax=Gulosibacter sp. 10 TaxID=1255570 RepID=UPI00097F2766|nr:nitroreductase family protein [Gulosibacter sp. 10]SJM68006.1 Nitroreductase [Gulosibacter sp. 10]